MRDVGEVIIERDDGTGYGGKLCKCKDCGKVRRCTPNFDFYIKKDGDLLQCESCFRSGLDAHGVKLGDGFGPIDREN